MNWYTISFIVTLVLLLFLNWYDRTDLTVSDLIVFTLAAAVPGVNIVFVCYVAFSVLSGYDITDFEFPTILKGRK